MRKSLKTIASAVLVVVASDVCLADSYSDMIMSLNPIGYWRLGESGGLIAADEVGISNGTYMNGTMLNDAGAISGNTAIHLDGSNDYVEIPHNNAYLMDEGTISLWFKADTNQSRQELFSKDSKNYDTGGHVTIMLKNSHAEVRFQSKTNSYWLNSSDLTITDWNHLLLTFGPNGIELFINGQSEDTDAYTGGFGATSGGIGNYEPIVIGGNTWISDDLLATPVIDHFDGHIDEVVLLGFKPTAEQITNLTSTDGGSFKSIKVVEWNAAPPISSN